MRIATGDWALRVLVVGFIPLVGCISVFGGIVWLLYRLS